MVLSSLAWTALLMGLAGGPHCVAMCGAACAALGRSSGGAAQPIQWVAAGQGGALADPGLHSLPTWRECLFQIGRLIGYAGAGALAAVAVGGLAWLSGKTAMLRPVWSLFHVAVLAWGLWLVIRAEQPAWVQGAARSVWQRVQPLTARGSGVFATGMAWAFMPCGLLYSALLVAGLAGGPAEGALVMALFALGGSVSLLLGPWLWRSLRQRVNGWHQDWGTRLAGLFLCALAGWSLWLDIAHRVADWCQ
jgi:uncharacterized protein